MNPVRVRRLVWVLLLVVAAAISTTLVALALQRNVAYLYTPVEVLRGEAGERARFRLGGMVEKGSFERTPGSLVVHFKVTDGDALLPVRYGRILPDLFREGQAVVATGTMQDGVFVAEDVLAKHDENYMPPEAAEALDKARHGQMATAPKPGAKQ